MVMGAGIVLIIGGWYVMKLKSPPVLSQLQDQAVAQVTQLNPLSIEYLRKQDYPSSDVTIEETLSPGSNYKRYIASYLSEGNKIYALLTVPNGTKPDSGWPVVVFNHGFIRPQDYQTTSKYIAYTDAFSRASYIVLKSDFRGHGESEGQPSGAYGSPGYTIDVLNAVATMKKYSDADPNRIGMWGHSMGGYITLRNMVVSKDIKAGVIWGGVVANYPDLIQRWRRPVTSPRPSPSPNSRRWRDELVAEFGAPDENNAFWKSISANSYLNDISGPLQLHHSTTDASVPVEFSQKLQSQLKEAGKEVEIFIYSGDDHNISHNFSLAIRRSVEFFDKYVKGVRG